MSTKSPTIKRILKEASELANSPSADYHAAPLETDLFEWHFTLRGPPAPSPFEGGMYHGRIVLPPAYPLKPPSFRFLTPTGRFEVNREICLSISGHHEETWQPAWGVRTALVAIRSFMDTSASGQLGGMEASDEVRRRLAGQSTAWKCPACGKSNAVIMREQEDAVHVHGESAKKDEIVPEELRLAYRDELAEKSGTNTPASRNVKGNQSASTGANPVPEAVPPLQTSRAATVASQAQAPPTQPQPQPTMPAQLQRQEQGVPSWIDKAIYGVIAALAFLLWRRWIS